MLPLLPWLPLTTCIADDSPFRCTAPANDLDSGHHVRRSQAHTELLVEESELRMLWDEYGLVGDIVVCSSVCFRFNAIHLWLSFCFTSHSLMVSPGQILTSFCHPIYYTSWSKAPSRTTLSSVLRSGPVRFFCYFWTNRNRNRLPNTEIQKKPDQNRKKPQKTGPNQFERNQLKLIKTDQNRYFSSIY